MLDVLLGMDMPPLSPALAQSIFYRELLWAGGATLLLLGCALVLDRVLDRLPGRRALLPHVASPPGRNLLACGLGLLWVLDGLLQAQPLMATRFIGGVVAPLLSGEPRALAAPIGMAVRLWGLAPIGWNVFATCLQLAIGLAVLFGREATLRRAGLVVSLFWGLAVWVCGEALGGVFVGGSWLSGAPGSVLLYMIAAVLLLLPAGAWRQGGWRRWFARGMGLLWLSDALLEAWPAAGFWGRGGLSAYLGAMAAMPQPAALADPLRAWAHAVGAAPDAWNAGLVLVLLLLGLAWLCRPADRRLWSVTAIWVLLTWWLGQDFGVLGGMGTDPNSGAILGLLVAVYAVACGAWAGAGRKAGAGPEAEARRQAEAPPRGEVTSRRGGAA